MTILLVTSIEVLQLSLKRRFFNLHRLSCVEI